MSSHFHKQIKTFIVKYGLVIIFMSLVILLGGSLSSQATRFSWPIIKGTPPNLTGISSTFGESRTDHFHAGVDILGSDMPIKPMAGGKILYYNFESMNPYRPMAGAGNQVWIDHGEGWWSGYYHLSEFRMNQRYTEKDRTIAISGHTGRSGGPHLHFILTKDYGTVYVNPMIEYLSQANEDNAPIIEHLVFVTDNGISRLKPNQPDKAHKIRLTRHYPLYIELKDPGLEKGSRRSPKLVEWSLKNSENIVTNGSIDFQNIKLHNGNLLLNGNSEFEAVYFETFLKLGDPNITNGINQLTVKAVDYSGNQATESFVIDVKREY
ncbi:MAG: M23 family metallopeptidase [Leptonema sp. (in: Bacteria)]|nr:M23 family metallopeptidase [Leptonema sp. (in: bacteria)]